MHFAGMAIQTETTMYWKYIPHQGEPIVTYQFDDVAPLLYCIDEKKRLLYGYRYDMPDTFLIYSLP